ncbi:MAG: copper resistance CopC/CopD family protein, partial [Jatrophihabitans sp.]
MPTPAHRSPLHCPKRLRSRRIHPACAASRELSSSAAPPPAASTAVRAQPLHRGPDRPRRAAPASAHAVVVSASPADGARLATAPTSVSVTFDETVGLSGIGYLQVVDGYGNRVDSGAATQTGATIKVALRPGLGDGTYVSSYRVISADSHPVTGSLRFVVGNGALPPAKSATSATDRATSIAFDASRGIGYAGLAGLGGGWLLLSVWPRGRQDGRARRLIWAGWWATVFGSAAEPLLQGPYTAGAGLAALRHGALLHDTLRSSFGAAHSVRLVLLAALAAMLERLFRSGRRPAWLVDSAAVLAVGVGLTYAVAGHANTASPRWLALASDTAHVLAMAGWLGGAVLLAVAIVPDPSGDEPSAAVRGFSRIAPWLISVLLLTGTYQAWRETRGWHALFDTTYGVLVIVKSVVLIVVVVVASWSRRAVQLLWGARCTGTDSAVTPSLLRRLVAAEVVVAAVALGAAAVLVAEPPGRTVAA